MSDRLNVLLFGGCLLHQPLKVHADARDAICYSSYGPIRQIHSFGEMFQMIAILRGEADVPQEYRILCRMSPDLKPVAGADTFADIDLVLVEPASPIEIDFRGVNINRNAIMDHVVVHIRTLGRDAAKVANTWFRLGLLAMNDELQAEAARKLLDLIPDEMPNAALARAVIAEARARRQEVLDGFVKLRSLMKRPMAVVVYIFSYLSDGRAVSWPAGFHEEVLAAAQKLRLPVFDPAPSVREFGVTRALKDDLRHYNDAFLPTIGEALLNFAQGAHASYKNAITTRIARAEFATGEPA